MSADIVAFCIAAAIGVCAAQYPLGGSLSQLSEIVGGRAQLLGDFGPAICALLAVIGMLASRARYTHRIGLSERLRDLALASVTLFAAGGASAFMFGAAVPRALLCITAVVFMPAALLLHRAARMALDAAGMWRLPVVVVGSGAWADRAAQLLASEADLGYAVAATIEAPRAGHIGWRRVLASHGARLLVLACEAGGTLDPALISSLVRERVSYALLPEQAGLPVVGAARIGLAQDAVLVCYRNNLKKPAARALKMAFDVVAAGAALTVLAPVLLVIAALVKLDGGPVLFAHKRIGARGQTFKCLKFRSMVVDSDAALQALLERDTAAREEWAHTHKLRHDPRVTWIGRILRKTSLDELPQLFNVLCLEMSLVGPRPIVSQEVPKYGDDISYYYETRPGITGLWQVSGRSDTTYTRRVYLDSWYVKNWTLWRDLGILMRTVPAVLSTRGAG